MRALQRVTGLSFQFMTHNIGAVEYIADAVAVMRNGCIVEQGECADVIGRKQDDHTRSLLAAMPRIEPQPSRDATPFGLG